jgi:hypothetical protein
MRRVFVALAFCFCSLAMHGQKTRLGQGLPHAKPGDDYPIKVHISGLHYRGEYIGSGQTADVIYADAVMNGKKVELQGDREVPFQYYKLPLGDYQARLLKDPHKMGDTPIFQIYEVVLPDRTVWRCTVTGILE